MTCDIRTEQWHDFFSNLLSCQTGKPEAAAVALTSNICHHCGYSGGDDNTLWLVAAASVNESATPHHLYAVVTTDEVTTAEEKLKRNKAAGTDGIRADSLKNASESLIPHSTAPSAVLKSHSKRLGDSLRRHF